MSHTDELCPICLAPAPVNTAAASEHLATHSREELITAFGSMKADLAAEIKKCREEGMDGD